jgi:hypothetical protein
MFNMPVYYALPRYARYSTKVGGVLLLLLALLVCRPTEGAEAGSLYVAEVPVAGQQTEQRNESIREAFRKVLVKVTGHRGVVQREGLKLAIQEAAGFVQKYSYRLASGIDSVEAGDAPRRLLEVEFDERAVNQLLRDLGLPIWGGTRPLILVWMGIEKEGRRVHLTPGLDLVVEQAALGVGRDRGLAMMLPMMDFEDRSRLQISDLWGGFATNIRAASRRYGPDLIVSGRVHKVSDQLWRVHWTLLKENGFFNWKSEGPSSASATATGLQQLADRLAVQFAPIGNVSDVIGFRMRIGGIQYLGDYERAQAYLQGLNSVQQAKLLYAEPQAVVFDLQVRGGRELLDREISMGNMLQRDPGGGPGGVKEGVLTPPGSTHSAADEMVLYYQMQP